MKAFPILVSHQNKINYGEQPRLGLASLLLECGYLQAERFALLLGEVIDTRSLYALLSLYSLTCSASVSASITTLHLTLPDIDKQQLLAALQLRAPRYAKGWGGIEALVASSDASNYKSVYEWFGYPVLEKTTMLDNPLSLLDWLDTVDNSLASLNECFRRGDLYGYVSEVLRLQTGVDLSLHKRLRQQVRRWVSLSYSRYAFGASVDQSLWLVPQGDA